MPKRSGYTLMEMLITVIVIALIAGMAVPQYQKTVRRARLRAAVDILRSMFAGEQTYAAYNSRQYRDVPAGTTAAANTAWTDIYMDNPNVGLPRTPTQLQYLVFVDNAATPPTFIAAATIPGTLNTVYQIAQDNLPVCLPGGPVGGYIVADCP